MLQLSQISLHTISNSAPLQPNRHGSVLFQVRHQNPIPLHNFRCLADATSTKSNQTRSGNSKHYKKNIWAPEFIQSLKSDFTEETHKVKLQKLNNEVRNMFDDDAEGMDLLDKLELIDALQRLGVDYQFDDEIKKTLGGVILCNKNSSSLHSTALYFRILRQQGYEVSPDLFNRFMNDKGSFKAELCNDINGMLSLYEASHLFFEGHEERMMHEAKDFTLNHLRLVHGNYNTDPILGEQVSHALELPLQWRMPRMESRWRIEYLCRRSKQRIDGPSKCLLEFAKLDFNMLQATHQKDLTIMSRWWGDLGVSKFLAFARDRLVESFLWTVGLTYEPQYRRAREWLTKVVNFIVVIDDIYDIYGSVDELELFTAAVDRWDIDHAMRQLPDYMQVCFVALYNTTNEMVYTSLKTNGTNILPHLKKVWTELCTAMLVEAKWSKNGCTPSLQEYLANAWVSSSTPVVLTHAFFATNQKATKDSLECLFDRSSLIHQASIIFRLCNDLATSSAELERGDVASAIQCYMKEKKVSESEARSKITGLVTKMWGKMNKSISSSPFSSSFANIIKNHVRTGHSIYRYGDGIGVQDHDAEERVMTLLVKTID